MATLSALCVFSVEGEFLAIAGLDGEIKIWETASGDLKQRFNPSTAGGQVHSIAWSKPVKGKRKRKSSSQSLYLAVAVDSGVVVWNVLKGELETSLLSSQGDSVSDVCWGRKLLYGSRGCHVTECDVIACTEQHKWKVDRHTVTCVHCHSNGETMLSAGRSIKLWSLQDYSLLQKYTGHATNVRGLRFISEELFLSTAEADRTINVWSSAEGSRTAVCTLSCDQEVRSCDLRVDKTELMEAAAVSDEGLCHLFRVQLTNRITEPVVAYSSIQYVSESKDPLPILAAHTSTSLTLAHGSHIRPHIEMLDFDQSDRSVCLVREAPLSGLLLTQQSTKRSKVKGSAVTILGPGNMTVESQRQPTNQIADSVPLSDRLEPVPKPKSAGRPSAESLTQLLTQAVASGDGKLLEEVLRVHKEKVVRSTVRRLPVTVVLPFLRKLLDLLDSQPGRGLELSLWIRTILTNHTAYLMTVPNLVDSLSGLYQLLDARVGTFSRLLRLQGKLDLMLTQAAASDDTDVDHTHLTTPLASVTAGENLLGELGENETESSDEDWSSASESSLSDQSDHSDIAMETDHTEYVR